VTHLEEPAAVETRGSTENGSDRDGNMDVDRTVSCVVHRPLESQSALTNMADASPRVFKRRRLNAVARVTAHVLAGGAVLYLGLGMI